MSNSVVKKVLSNDAPQPLSSAKLRGAVTTLLSGSLAAIFNLIGIQIGVPEQINAVLTIYVLGSIIAYIADIIFAKDAFIVPNKNLSVTIPYSDYAFRIKWLFKSFLSSYFFRFIVTIIIDTLVGMVLLTKLIEFLDDKNVHFWMRDTILTVIIALCTFVLYNNVLRFDWAYNDERNLQVDMIVFMWCSLALMFYALTYQKKDQKKENNNKDIEDIEEEKKN